MTHKVSSTYLSQSSGQAKVSNREIKSILKKTVDPSIKDWNLCLDDACERIRLHIRCPLVKLVKKSSTIVTIVFPYAADEIQSFATSKVFKVNGHRLKPFYESLQVESVA